MIHIMFVNLQTPASLIKSEHFYIASKIPVKKRGSIMSARIGMEDKPMTVIEILSTILLLIWYS